MVGKVTPNTKASASRLPAMMGLSKYQSPNDELNRYIDAFRGIEPPPLSDPEPASWGDKLEDMILKEACLRIGMPNLDPGPSHGLPPPELAVVLQPGRHGRWPAFDGRA
jgi:hypothetical protein